MHIILFHSPLFNHTHIDFKLRIKAVDKGFTRLLAVRAYADLRAKAENNAVRIYMIAKTVHMSAYIRSLVIPGVSFTIEILSPARVLKRVDFPTFGRPTMATIGLLIFFLL